MQIIKLELNNKVMSSNCYLLIKNSECIVIDPGFEDNTLYNYLINNKLNVTKVLLTHGHYDHWTGLEKLLKLYPKATLYANSLDEYFFDKNSFTKYYPKIDVDLLNKTEIDLLGHNFKIIKTPGHSNGSVSFYFNKLLFSGDVLFFSSIGRYDLYGGNLTTLLNSINELMKLPSETIVYSGHGRPTTLAFEKANNPFLK